MVNRSIASCVNSLTFASMVSTRFAIAGTLSISRRTHVASANNTGFSAGGAGASTPVWVATTLPTAWRTCNTSLHAQTFTDSTAVAKRSAYSGWSVLVDDIARRSWTCVAVAGCSTWAGSGVVVLCSAWAGSGVVVLAADPSAEIFADSVAGRGAITATGVVNAARVGRDAATRRGGVATVAA